MEWIRKQFPPCAGSFTHFVAFRSLEVRTGGISGNMVAREVVPLPEDYDT